MYNTWWWVRRVYRVSTVPGEERDHHGGWMATTIFTAVSIQVYAQASKQTERTNERTLIFGLYATSHPVACAAAAAATAPGSHPVLPLPEKPEGARLLKLFLRSHSLLNWTNNTILVYKQTNTKMRKTKPSTQSSWSRPWIPNDFHHRVNFDISKGVHIYALVHAKSCRALSKSNLERIIALLIAYNKLYWYVYCYSLCGWIY